MVIIRVEHDNFSKPTQYLVVGDEHPYRDAEELFNKHMNTCEIKTMERVGVGRDVINSWAQ